LLLRNGILRIARHRRAGTRQLRRYDLTFPAVNLGAARRRAVPALITDTSADSGMTHADV
jgi:hypothetical protein